MFRRQVEVGVRVPVSTRHLDEFLRSTCAQDVLPFYRDTSGVAAALTVSMAALVAARKALGRVEVKEKVGTVLRSPSAMENVVCVVIGGEGVLRTGALVAHKTKWNVLCVGPEVAHALWPDEVVDRLSVVRSRVDEIKDRIRCDVGVLLVVGSDRHLEVAWSKLDARERKVAVSVTEKAMHGLASGSGMDFAEYHDPGVLSDANLVRVWTFERCPGCVEGKGYWDGDKTIVECEKCAGW
jgi:hypothetical protein